MIFWFTFALRKVYLQPLLRTIRPESYQIRWNYAAVRAGSYASGQQWIADVVAPPSVAVWLTWDAACQTARSPVCNSRQGTAEPCHMSTVCAWWHSIYVTRSATSSQCKSSCKIWVRPYHPWSNFLVSLTTCAAAFLTRCRVSVTDFVALASTALHCSTREVTNAWTSVAADSESSDRWIVGHVWADATSRKMLQTRWTRDPCRWLRSDEIVTPSRRTSSCGMTVSAPSWNGGPQPTTS